MNSKLIYHPKVRYNIYASMIEITGKVVHGDHYGRELGFPTANMDRREYVRRKLKVRLGIWSGTAAIVVSSKYLVSREYKAAIVVGPVDGKGLPKIEAHLLGFKGNLYGKRITIYLHKFLRPFKKYKTLEALKAQIQKDIERVKKYEKN